MKTYWNVSSISKSAKDVFFLVQVIVTEFSSQFMLERNENN